MRELVRDAGGLVRHLDYASTACHLRAQSFVGWVLCQCCSCWMLPLPATCAPSRLSGGCPASLALIAPPLAVRPGSRVGFAVGCCLHRHLRARPLIRACSSMAEGTRLSAAWLHTGSVQHTHPLHSRPLPPPAGSPSPAASCAECAPSTCCGLLMWSAATTKPLLPPLPVRCCSQLRRTCSVNLLLSLDTFVLQHMLGPRWEQEAVALLGEGAQLCRWACGGVSLNCRVAVPARC